MEGARVAWLVGPFGTVAGGHGQPATAAPDGRPLDTWMRAAQLELAVDPDPVSPAAVRVEATASDGSVTELPLRDGRWLLAPDTPGRYVITAIVGAGSGASRHAWLVDVPDREGSWETLLELPAPEATLRGGGATVAGERGHGCYAMLCQEVGHRPPAHTLEPLRVGVGEALELELSDGSALVHWEGELEPQPGTSSETRLARATYETPVAAPVLAGLEPDAPGEWLLELRADYDRERGWQWFLFRVVAE
jgi:hypothetical protein